MTREETAWFERLYAAAEAGEAEVPWHRGGPNPFVEQWVRDLLIETGVGERMKREGLLHHGIELRFKGAGHRIDFAALRRLHGANDRVVRRAAGLR